MDLLAAEIARKRKAKAELAAVGGVRKYAKKGQKEEAARGFARREKDADRGPGAAVAGGEVDHLGEDALVVDPASANPAAGRLRARRPHRTSASRRTTCPRWIRPRRSGASGLGEPATLFAEDDRAAGGACASRRRPSR